MWKTHLNICLCACSSEESSLGIDHAEEMELLLENYYMQVLHKLPPFCVQVQIYIYFLPHCAVYPVEPFIILTFKAVQHIVNCLLHAV